MISNDSGLFSDDIYSIMKNDIYKFEKVDICDEKISKQRIVLEQEIIFLKIDNRLSRFLGADRDDYYINILDKEIDSIQVNMQLLQQKRYNSVYHEFFIEKTIKEWLFGKGNKNKSINEDLSEKLVDENIKISLPIKVDMKKIKSDDVNSMNKHILPVNGLAKEIIDNSVNGKTKNNKQGVTYNYIYVVQRNDGMVIVVGKSQFKLVNGKVSSAGGNCGDLYHELNLGNGQVGT